MAIYSAFADILDYPARPVERLLAEIALECPEARASIEAFQGATQEKSTGELQEIYIKAFDLRPDCTPNLGYHLFGDDGRRGLFLAELKGRMEAAGIALGSELPDHLSLVLRFVDRVAEERAALIEDCMLPALARVADILDATENPYKHAVRALLSVLEREQPASSELESSQPASSNALFVIKD